MGPIGPGENRQDRGWGLAPNRGSCFSTQTVPAALCGVCHGARHRPEAEQKRKDGDRPDRVEGFIESGIQNRIRSRELDIDR